MQALLVTALVLGNSIWAFQMVIFFFFSTEFRAGCIGQCPRWPRFRGTARAHGTRGCRLPTQRKELRESFRAFFSQALSGVSKKVGVFLGVFVFGFFISFLQTSLALMVQPLEVAFLRLHLALGASGDEVQRRLLVDVSSLLHSAFYGASGALLELARQAFVTPPGSPENAAAWTRLYKVLYTDAATGVFPSFFAALGPGAYEVVFFFEHGSSRFSKIKIVHFLLGVTESMFFPALRGKVELGTLRPR